MSKALGTSPEFWYDMQVNCDLWQAKKKFAAKGTPSRSAKVLADKKLKPPLPRRSLLGRTGLMLSLIGAYVPIQR